MSSDADPLQHAIQALVEVLVPALVEALLKPEVRPLLEALFQVPAPKFRDLPKDLVEDEILCHVPATNLKRLGSTCKRWKRLFKGDCRFARKHTYKAAKEFLVLMLTGEGRLCPAICHLDGPVPSVEVKSELSLVDDSQSADEFDIGQVLHCDGLLLCTSEDESRFVVWNLFTGETRWFRPSIRGERGRTFLLGYSQEDNKKSYKVLSFYDRRKDYEIYEFSSDSWRVLDGDAIVAPGWSFGLSWLGVSLKGSSYWFAVDETKAPQRYTSLLKFDFSTEKFVPVPLPYQCDGFEVHGLSVVKEEKLSVILQRDATCKTEIWVTDKVVDEKTVSWSKVLALDLSPDLQLRHDTNFLLDEEKRVVMICFSCIDLEDEDQDKDKDVIYIVGEDNKVTLVDFGFKTTNSVLPKILTYVPSLVQIEPARGKRKRGD